MSSSRPVPAPPLALQRPVTVVQHGATRHDPYAWLRDADWRAVMRDPARLDPVIRAHLEAENAYTAAVLAPVAGLQASLVAEMRARIKPDDATVPFDDGPFAYYVRYAPEGQHPVWCRRRGGDGPEEVLVDGDAEAAGQAFCRFAACAHSPDHRFVAYTVDLTGSEHFTLVVREIGAWRAWRSPEPQARGDFAWANDSRTIYYTTVDENLRPRAIARHRLDAPQGPDAVVYHEDDPGFYVAVERGESGRFALVGAWDHSMTSEVRLIDLDDPGATPRLIAPRERGVEYHAAHNGDRLFVRTNADGAADFKIAAAPLAAPERVRWTDVVPHKPGRLVRAMLMFREHLVYLAREDGLPRITVVRLADGASHDIAFEGEEAYELGLVPGFAFDTPVLRFTYSSMATPQQVFDYDMRDRTRTLRKMQEVPSGHDPARYAVRRFHAPSHDGTPVPVSVVHRRDLSAAGGAPLLLYGYGSYGASIPAGFAPNRLSLVDRGFVYAIAHPRGGSDLGRRWYEDGKLLHKKNTFRDYIACAEYLAASGLVDRARVVGHGGSAGGMLMGAVANLRPDLFRALVAEVPFVDVLNTMSDATLPLTPPEWFEWGNPIEDAEAFRYIASYSPYDNVSAQAYPDILATGGLTDPRVTYWEPAKWVARLRAATTGPGRILLQTNMSAGHGGAAGRYDKLEEVARVYAFVLMVCGMAG
ncbi:MAG: S9 family peptidase [Rhodospirillaceae bacterium]